MYLANKWIVQQLKKEIFIAMHARISIFALIFQIKLRRISNFASEFPSLFIYLLNSKCLRFCLGNICTSLFLSQCLSPTCKSYRKTVAPAPETQCFCIHSASFPLPFRWWIKTFDIFFIPLFEYRPSLTTLLTFKSYKTTTFHQFFSTFSLF